MSVAEEIHVLRTELMAAHREAGDLSGGEAACQAADERAWSIKARLLVLYAAFFDATEAALTKRCPIHGDAIIVTCGECQRVHGLGARRVA